MQESTIHWVLVGALLPLATRVRLLRHAGCRIAGLAVNRYVADTARAEASMSSNGGWLARMNNAPILVTVPDCPPASVAPDRGRLPEAFLDAVGLHDWTGSVGRGRPGG